MFFFVRAALVLAGAITWASACSAQVFLVDPMEAHVFGFSGPTPTFLWPGREAKAVLIMIPGGEGHLGLAPDQRELGGFYANTLRPLSDPSQGSGGLDVVIFDSPYRLPVGDTYPTSRATPDHLSRIESVVRYYKEKLKKPVWLMGHSNGAVSVTEFWRSIRDGEKKDMISGLIVSSSRKGISFPDDTDIPVLFLHHAKDRCPKADPRASVAAYETLKATDKNRVEYVWISGGQDEGGNGCYSGYHMYFGAAEEAVAAIDRFITPR